jgi:hypothetical protein
MRGYKMIDEKMFEDISKEVNSILADFEVNSNTSSRILNSVALGHFKSHYTGGDLFTMRTLKYILIGIKNRMEVITSKYIDALELHRGQGMTESVYKRNIKDVKKKWQPLISSMDNTIMEYDQAILRMMQP